MPLEGSGGALGIVRHVDVGRQPLDLARVESGSTLVDFDFAPSDERLLLTALENARIKVFKLPPDAALTRRTGKLCSVVVVINYYY